MATRFKNTNGLYQLNWVRTDDLHASYGVMGLWGEVPTI